MQSTEFSFSRTVTESLQRSAAAADIDLLVLDNQDSPSMALHNTEVLLREHLDLVIESQTDTRIAGQIFARFRVASIPVIALEIPNPQTIFYGANNSQAGLHPLAAIWLDGRSRIGRVRSMSCCCLNCQRLAKYQTRVSSAVYSALSSD